MCEGPSFGSVVTDVSSFTHRNLFWQRWSSAWRALQVGVLKSLMRDWKEKQREGGLLSLCWQLILVCCTPTYTVHCSCVAPSNLQAERQQVFRTK